MVKVKMNIREQEAIRVIWFWITIITLALVVVGIVITG
jgi:hypothetical protein